MVARFVGMLGVRLGFTYLETPIPQLEQLFSLQHQQRVICDMVFLFKLINGLVDCPDLLTKIGLTVPRGTRSHSAFSRRFFPTSYAYNCGVARLQRLGGIFHGTIPSFRRNIKQLNNLL
ncbi:hypothetical protein J6590_032219 [Homalodisca vitripennis]|nr:hypothetical protein J6590_032219 [Homalodisca vitripennis]